MVTASKDISTETMSQIAASKNNKYELRYFPFHGVLPALRAMLAMSGADYTFTHPEAIYLAQFDWTTEKPTTPFGSLPILYETCPTSGHTIQLAELSAIELYLGEKYGWLGDNHWERYQVQMYHSSSQAVFDKLVTTVVRAPKDQMDRMMEIWIEKILSEWVEYHEKVLKANGCNGHYIGNKARHLNSVTEIPHFEIEPEYALETLMAADFLDSTSTISTSACGIIPAILFLGYSQN
ncbi:hypothetical protein FBU30_000133 [Linnemannia zychae]|nr:hypothetical protein FBU30_000133 [Linnemannia zychae]